MFKKNRRTYKVKPRSHSRRSRKSRTPLLRKKSQTKSLDLPSWYKATLPQIKKTLKHKYNPTTESPQYSHLSFKHALYPAWVGKEPYPDKVDLIQGRHFGGPEYGVGGRHHQLIWKEHLKAMKQSLPSEPKIPSTVNLWTSDQLEILRNFYKIHNPKKLTDQTRRGFDGLVKLIGPFVAEKEIRDNYTLPFTEQLRGKKIIDLKLKPHIFTLKKGTYLFHGSPQHDLEFKKLHQRGFFFFGLSTAISLWYTVERFSKQARAHFKRKNSPGEFEAYLYVYQLEKDLKFQYIEDDILYNQEAALYNKFCNNLPCLHPQFAYHSIEQLNNARGPVELDWELTIPVKQLDKIGLSLVGKYYIDVLKLLKHSHQNITQFDPITAIDFNNLL